MHRLLARRSKSPLFTFLLGGAMILGLGRELLGSQPAGGGYARPDAAAIREQVREILSDPRFAPRKTVWQWLADLFGNWKLPNLHLPHGLTETLMWMLVVWCILALLAILAHFIWTLVILFRGAGVVRGGSGRGTLAERLRHHSLEELAVMMQRLAERGEFREATGFMMLALIKWLDRAGALRFHESKTNGEYVLEYAPERPERDDFKRFVIAFEGTVYGGRECDAQYYAGMREAFEQMKSRVVKVV